MKNPGTRTETIFITAFCIAVLTWIYFTEPLIVSMRYLLFPTTIILVYYLGMWIYINGSGLLKPSHRNKRVYFTKFAVFIFIFSGVFFLEIVFFDSSTIKVLYTLSISFVVVAIIVSMFFNKFKGWWLKIPSCINLRKSFAWSVHLPRRQYEWT